MVSILGVMRGSKQVGVCECQRKSNYQLLVCDDNVPRLGMIRFVMRHEIWFVLWAICVSVRLELSVASSNSDKYIVCL